MTNERTVRNQVSFFVHPGRIREQYFVQGALTVDDDRSGLAAVRAYCARTQAASVREITSGANQERLNSEPSLFLLTVASPDDQADLAAQLVRDPRVSTAAAPTILRAVTGTQETLLARVNRKRFALFRTQFANALGAWRRSQFDQAIFSPGTGQSRQSVHVIDEGRPTHSAMCGRVIIPEHPADSVAMIWHGTAVCGIIAACQNASVPRGCCDASIVFHNVVEAKGASVAYSEYAFLTAMRKFLDSDDRVLNISMSGFCGDTIKRAMLDEAERRGKVIVAAMPGRGSTDGEFPCVHPTVIATGSAHYPHNGAAYTANPECKALLSAYGQQLKVLGIADSTLTESGTSFAAPAVSAAVWLALQACPALTPNDIRQLLKSSAIEAGHDTASGRDLPFDDSRGWGPMNARIFARNVTQRAMCQ
jgi:subtilisin family serine protease